MDDIFNKPLCELIDRRTFLKMGGAAGLSAMLAALAIKPSLAETIITDNSIKSDAIDYTPIGAVSPSTGAFTTLKADTDPVDEHGVGDRGFNDTRYLSDIVEDTTPQLGGNLDAQSNIIQGDVENNLNAMEFGSQVLGLMTDPRLLNVMCESPLSDMVTNGTFASDTGWTIGTGWTIAAGVAHHATGTGSTIYQQLGMIPGIAYRVQYTISNYVAGAFYISVDLGVNGPFRNANGTYTETTIPKTGANGVIFLTGNSTFVGDIDNVSVTPAYIDISGKLHDGQYMGTWTASDRLKQGKCWVLDPNGTDAYINLGDSDDFSFGDGSNDSPFTVFGLIEVVNGGVQRVISKWDDTTGSILAEWVVQFNADETLVLVLKDNSATVLCKRTTNTALSFGLHTYVITYSGLGGATAANGITIYIDGAEVASTTVNNASYVAMENLVVPVLIGTYENASGIISDFFLGDFGLTGIDAVEWSAADVWQLWQMVLAKYSENGVDLS